MLLLPPELSPAFSCKFVVALVLGSEYGMMLGLDKLEFDALDISGSLCFEMVMMNILWII